MNLKTLIRTENTKRKAVLSGQVVPDRHRCVQCGVCTFHCPIGIDIRRHAWSGLTIEDSHCLTCGECVIRCPRGVLRLERVDLLSIREPG